MELTREHFRWIRLYDLDCHDTSARDELKFLFGDKAASYGTVKNCFNEFHRGRRSLKHNVPEGRPKIVALSENINVVRELICKIVM